MGFLDGLELNGSGYGAVSERMTFCLIIAAFLMVIHLVPTLTTDEYTSDGWFYRNYLDLTEVPPDIPAEAVGVYINSNSISEIKSGAFSNLSSCTFLSLSWNLITEIEPGAFQGLNSIDDLTLFQNKLTRLKYGMSQGLEALDNLVLSNNLIDTIEDGAIFRIT